MTKIPDLIKKNLKAGTLAIFLLNVGDGDAIIVKFPDENGQKTCAVIDCYDAGKTIAALQKIKPHKIAFICATHPHYDHTKGLQELIEYCLDNHLPVAQFWDSGFRHVSKTHYLLIKAIQKNPGIQFITPTSGYQCTINLVQVMVLSPSIHLKNRYDTFGVNINNASIVLKLEYPPKEFAQYFLPPNEVSDKDLAENEKLQQRTVILGGDAQFDAWAKITDEFPELIRTENRGKLIDSDVIKHRPLRCQVLKMPHHMSKHGISLEVLETIRPQFALASCASQSKHGFPHELTVMAMEDVWKQKSDKKLRFTGHRTKELRSGTIVALLDKNRKNPLVYSLGEAASKPAPLPDFN